MAIFRITSQTKVRTLAKKTVRYIVHRRDRGEENTTRQLYSRFGISKKSEAYQAIDQAWPGTTFFRMVVSPDPRREDTKRDLDLRVLFKQTMQAVEARLRGQRFRYFATIHTDHSDIRHVHILALISGRLSKQDLRVIREAATTEARIQRQTLDQDRQLGEGRQPERGGAALSALARSPNRPRLLTRGVFFAVPARQSWRSGGPPRRSQSCVTCGPWTEMQKISRTLYHCAGCGTIVRDEGLGLKIVRTPHLSLSLGKEDEWVQ